MVGWIATLACSREEADAAAIADDPFAGFEPSPTLVAAESGVGWELQLYGADGDPEPALLAALLALAPSGAGEIQVGRLPDADWVALSQAGLEPVNIGRFHIHVGEAAGRARPGQWPIRIDAGLAFGTGQHATTAGCIAAAARLAKRVRGSSVPASVLDVGTGSGLLALAARRLFPRARLTAADLDAVAVGVARVNVRLNGAVLGRGRGAVALVDAPGVEHPLIIGRAPYDLVFANILAGPLKALAPSLAAVVARGGWLVLAGLLQPQARVLIAAYAARGLRLVARGKGVEWPVLVFRKVGPTSRRGAQTGSRRAAAGRGWRIDTL